MVRVTVAQTTSEIEQLRSAWEALHAVARQATIFQSFSWNQLAAQAFRDRQQPFVVYAENDAGAALIPAVLVLPARRIEFLGEALFDYRDVLATGEAEVLRTAWERIARLRLPFSLSALRDERRGELWSEFEPRFFVRAPQIRAGECSGEALAAAHRRLGRYWRRVLRAGAELRHYDGSASKLLRWLYAQKARLLGARPENLFNDVARIDFIIAVCAAAPGACEIFALEKDGHTMSALVTFRDRRTRRFYTVFYDPQFEKLSPGMTLLFEICCRTLAQGLDCDMMTGEQEFKQRLATSAVPLFRVDASAEALSHVSRLREPVSEVAA